MKRMVRSDPYTKVTLTIIAVCLVLSCLSDAGIHWAGRPGPVPVQLVSIGQTREDYNKLLPWRTISVQVANRSLDVEVGNIWLDVNVANTPLEVEIAAR